MMPHCPLPPLAHKIGAINEQGRRTGGRFRILFAVTYYPDFLSAVAYSHSEPPPPLLPVHCQHLSPVKYFLLIMVA